MHFKLSDGSRIYQYLAALTGCLGMMSSMMHFGWPSPSLPIIQSGKYTFKLTNDEGSWLAVMPLIGGVLGASFAGLKVDRFGRKAMILYSSIPLFLSWVMIGFATTPLLLFLARFLAGFADGLLFAIIPMYLGEIAEPQIRGLLGSICPVSEVLGILSISVIGSYLSISTAAFVSSSIPLLLLLTLMWMPESPYFLLMRGKYQEARKNLQMLRYRSDVDDELDRLAEAVREQNTDTGKFLDIFKDRTNRKAMFIALGLRTAQEVAGMTVLVFYCETIFMKTEALISPSVAAIIFFTVQLILSALSSFIVDMSGRRPLIIFSVAGTAVTLFIIGGYLYAKRSTDIDTSAASYLLLIGMICYVIFYSCGLQTIPSIVMGEIFPTNVKASALCLTDVYYNVMGTLTTKYFDAMTNSFGMHTPFFTFGALCIICLIIMYFYIPETKGKTLEEILENLRD